MKTPWNEYMKVAASFGLWAPEERRRKIENQ